MQRYHCLLECSLASIGTATVESACCISGSFCCLPLLSLSLKCDEITRLLLFRSSKDTSLPPVSTHLGSACRAAIAALFATLAASIASSSLVGPSRGLGGGLGLGAEGIGSGCSGGLGRGCVMLKGCGTVVLAAVFCCLLRLGLGLPLLLLASLLSCTKCSYSMQQQHNQ